MLNELEPPPEVGVVELFSGGTTRARARNGSAPQPADAASHARGPLIGGRTGNAWKLNRVKTSPCWRAQPGKTFDPEINELRRLVFGTLLKVARELVITQTQKPAKRPNNEQKDGQHTSFR